jgi:hypothetical protein
MGRQDARNRVGPSKKSYLAEARAAHQTGQHRPIVLGWSRSRHAGNVINLAD